MKHPLTSCWMESGHESSLMWKAYAGAEGVVVRTSFQNLQDSIRSVAELPVTFGQVEYVDYRRNEVPRFGWAPLLHKRTEYREEGELRAILLGPPWDHTGVPETPIPLDSDVAERRGRYVSVNLEVLVKEIVLAPHSTPWFAEVVSSVMHGLSVSPRVIRSAIESPPTGVESMNYRMTPLRGKLDPRSRLRCTIYWHWWAGSVPYCELFAGRSCCKESSLVVQTHWRSHSTR